jgi:SAM-dependent methyltransferase
MVESMQPYGQALTDYFNGNLSATEFLLRDDGRKFEMPAFVYFRDLKDFTIIENKALELCFGKILDIGAGAGIHTLELQNKGLNVTALDISPESVEIMKNRGIKNTECADIFTYFKKKFNTLLMLSHGIGLTSSLEGFKRFLNHAYELTESNGILIFDTLDVRITNDPVHLEYQERNKKMGRYFGEIHMQIEYKGVKGNPFSWLHIYPETLAKEVAKTGWIHKIIHKEPSGDYLVKLSKE